jgi:hypothetical protein
VEFKKPYAGGSFDFAVVPGTSVEFTHEIFDNQGGSHPNDGFDATVYTLDLAQIPAQVSLIVTPGAPTLDGVVSPGEWTSNPLVTQAGVTLNAMADGQFLYVSASWEDSTESIPKKLWAFDGSNWSQSGNEDRISFVWDMGLNGTDGANCATMCHVPLMHTNVGNVDVWHWKSARGNAMGVADDKYWDTADRQSDPGTSAYQDNNPVGSGFPSFMAVGDPGINPDFLAADASALSAFDPYGTVAAHTVAVATPFDSTASFSAGNVIPGYLHRVPLLWRLPLTQLHRSVQVMSSPVICIGSLPATEHQSNLPASLTPAPGRWSSRNRMLEARSTSQSSLAHRLNSHMRYSTTRVEVTPTMASTQPCMR